MIPDDKIAEVRERTDIVALVQEFVALKKAGTSFKGLCPFHAEKTPSFHVHRDRQFFYCFGCQASGDAIQFLMRLEGRSFPEAVRSLAERAGVELPASDPAQTTAQNREKERLARWGRLMEAATQFYESQLKDRDTGEPARAELVRRGMEPSTVEAFRLGHAPASWDALARHLRQQGFEPADAEAMGLLVPRRQGAGHYDRFRHRLMFPIADQQGRVVAFSGRALPQTEKPKEGSTPAKYVNSPEGPLYQKGRALYGIHQARVPLRREGVALLCEGNFDLIALHQAGFQNAVAPLGTALTKPQCDLLRRFVERVVLIFDGDAAGKKAVERAAPMLSAASLQAQVATLPAGSDPDAFLREKGAPALRQLVSQAPGITEYLIDEAAFSAGSSAAHKGQAIAGLGPVLMRVGSPVEVQLYVERIGQKFGVSDLNAVRTQLRRGVRSSRSTSGVDGRNRAQGARNTTMPARGSATPEATQALKSNSKVPKLESELVGVILDNPKLLHHEMGEKLRKLLTNGDLRAIFDSAFRVTAAQPALTVPALLEDISTHSTEVPDTLSASGQRWVEERLMQQPCDFETAARILRDGVSRLELLRIEQRLPILSRQIIAARRQGETTKADALVREKEQLRATAMHLKGKK